MGDRRGSSASQKDGTFLGYIGSVIDITERKGIEDALKEAERRIDEFLANMSHEIRSPMTAILGYADILQDKLKDSDSMECVATIKQSGNYLLEIINDLLDLSMALRLIKICRSLMDIQNAGVGRL